MSPRILRAAGAARALAGDLGPLAEIWETGEGATVTATVQIGGGLSCVETLFILSKPRVAKHGRGSLVR